MVKKKQIPLAWSKKRIDNKLFFGAILIFLLICGVILFAYTSQPVNKSWFSIQDYFGTAYWNWKNSQPVIPSPTKPVRVNSSQYKYPTSTPTVAPIERLPEQSFDRLMIYKTRLTEENTATLIKVITDSLIINRIYYEIKSLPLWKSTGLPVSCPMDTGVKYTLNFYTNDLLTIHALVSPTGCRGVSFTTYQARWGLSSQGTILLKDLQQTLNLSDQDFYGYSR